VGNLGGRKGLSPMMIMMMMMRRRRRRRRRRMRRRRMIKINMSFSLHPLLLIFFSVFRLYGRRL
jgi:hypothetical protein